MCLCVGARGGQERGCWIPGDCDPAVVRHWARVLRPNAWPGEEWEVLLPLTAPSPQLPGAGSFTLLQLSTSSVSEY